MVSPITRTDFNWHHPCRPWINHAPKKPVVSTKKCMVSPNGFNKKWLVSRSKNHHHWVIARGTSTGFPLSPFATPRLVFSSNHKLKKPIGCHHWKVLHLGHMEVGMPCIFACFRVCMHICMHAYLRTPTRPLYVCIEQWSWRQTIRQNHNSTSQRTLWQSEAPFPNGCWTSQRLNSWGSTNFMMSHGESWWAGWGFFNADSAKPLRCASHLSFCVALICNQKHMVKTQTYNLGS